MTIESWKAKTDLKATRELERRKLEANFNAEIVRRYKSGQTKEEIVASLGITNTLFSRVVGYRRPCPL